MSDERRLFSRILFQTSAQLFTTGGEVDVDILDLSLKGALVRPQRVFPVARDEACTLRLHLGNGECSIRMAGRAAHTEGTTIGFACEEIDLDSITHLRRLVELNLGDETLLDRELAALSCV